MIKSILISLLFLLTLGNSFAWAKTEIKIGVIVPLTGDMSLHGVEIERSMRLAASKVAPESNYSYRLFFEDNALDSAKSVSAAQRLINIEKVDVVVTLWPPTASVVIPVSERAKVLHYTIAWDPALARENKLVLSHQAMVDQIARNTLQLLKSEDKSRVAFLHLEETGFNLGAKYIRDAAANEGIELIAIESFHPDETDFRSLISRLSRAEPEAYLIWSVMPSLDLLIRQIRNLSSEVFITGYFDYAQDENLIQNVPYLSEMFASESFIRLYESKYNESPVSKGPNAYDIMELLVQAYESIPERKPSAEEVKSYLTGIKNFQGAVGEFSIDPDGNSTYSPVVRKAIGSERVLIGKD